MTFPWQPAPPRPNPTSVDATPAATPVDYALQDRLHQALLHDLDETALSTLDKDQSREQVERALRALAGQIAPQLTGDDKEETVARVVNEVLGMGPLEPLLSDPTISEVMVNAPDEIYYERDGIIYASNAHFRDVSHVTRIVDRIVGTIGRHVSEASPMVDARLTDGSRVNIIIPPLVPKSPTITIRKFRGDRYKMSDLVGIGTLSERMATFVEACVKAKLNVVISGGTGSGKTTFLNSLSEFIPHRERIVTIEDPIELRLQQRHIVAMEARPASMEGFGEVTQRDLVRNALRMRPDRIIVGEVRGTEAFDMLQAMNTGHEGSLTTVHANSPRDALARIENMVLMAGFDLPVSVIREQMASAFHVMIHLSRLVDGSRRVVQVTEVSGMEGPVVTLQDIFTFRQQSIDTDGKIEGSMEATGVRPMFMDRLHAFGIEFAEDMFGSGRWR